jgi:peptide/nickel transport system ATP-binding protein
MQTPLLEVKDLYVRFKTFEGYLNVLNGVNLKVRPGEKVGLVGEAGCGKTTTMKSIMRILPTPPAEITGGQILFKGKDVLSMDVSEFNKIRRSGISMIFQDPTAALNPVFTIGSQIKSVIKYSGILKENADKRSIQTHAEKALENVMLQDPERLLLNYPIQLSGGMRQRVCIAMALVSNLELLLADEPGTSLDVTIKDQILRLLEDLVKERGVSIVLISHDLGTVKNTTDTTYVMYAGSMVETAKTEKIFLEPLHPYTKGLISTVPKLTGGDLPREIPGQLPRYINLPPGCRFSPRCDSVSPKCKEDSPPFFEVDKDHKVACWLFQK